MSKGNGFRGTGAVVGLLDRMIELYGPTFADMLASAPEANGIRGFVDRAEPSALLKDDQGRGYSDDDFEHAASAALRPLAGAMLDVMASAPLPRCHGCGFHLDADRTEDGEITVTAMITAKGAAFVRRTATVFRNNGFVLVAKPAEFGLMAFSEDPTLVMDVIQAARDGFNEAASAMRKTGTLHIFGKGDERAVQALLDGACIGNTARVSPIGRNGAWVIASSTKQPYKIFASGSAFEELKWKIPDDVSVTVLPEASPVPTFLN